MGNGGGGHGLGASLGSAGCSGSRPGGAARPRPGWAGAGTACPCACVCGVYKGALISVGASGPCHNAEIMSLLLSAHSTSSLWWLASSSRQNLPRLKWMCHHLPQQIRSPLMMGQTPLARRATAVIQAPLFFFFFFLSSLPFVPSSLAHPGPGASARWWVRAARAPHPLGLGLGGTSPKRPQSIPTSPLLQAAAAPGSRRPARCEDGFPAWAAIGSAPALPLG